eukprot:2376776-Prymnesium_polylepis.1
MPVSSHNVGRNCAVSSSGVERSSTTFDGVVGDPVNDAWQHRDAQPQGACQVRARSLARARPPAR